MYQFIWLLMTQVLTESITLQTYQPYEQAFTEGQYIEIIGDAPFCQAQQQQVKTELEKLYQLNPDVDNAEFMAFTQHSNLYTLDTRGTLRIIRESKLLSSMQLLNFQSKQCWLNLDTTTIRLDILCDDKYFDVNIKSNSYAEYLHNESIILVQYLNSLIYVLAENGKLYQFDKSTKTLQQLGQPQDFYIKYFKMGNNTITVITKNPQTDGYQVNRYHNQRLEYLFTIKQKCEGITFIGDTIIIHTKDILYQYQINELQQYPIQFTNKMVEHQGYYLFIGQYGVFQQTGSNLQPLYNNQWIGMPYQLIDLMTLENTISVLARDYVAIIHLNHQNTKLQCYPESRHNLTTYTFDINVYQGNSIVDSINYEITVAAPILTSKSDLWLIVIIVLIGLAIILICYGIYKLNLVYKAKKLFIAQQPRDYIQT